jgi:uncharacterized coiled-coil DUF342 family protein
MRAQEGRPSYKELREAHDQLKQIHASTNEANTEITKRCNQLEAQLVVVTGQRDGMARSLEVQKQVVRDELRTHQEERDEMVKEIEALRAELKALRTELRQ